MQRYNSFNMIHKALRALLYDTALCLQQTYFGDAAEAAAALEKVSHVIDQFESHAHHEDHFVLPLIQEYEPQVVDAFESEHVEDEALGRKLQQLMLIFREAPVTEARVFAGSAIVKAFTDFTVFNLQHMAKEETVINEVLWRYYTDEELMALSGKIAASIPDAEKAFTAKWMMRGINKIEAVNWLKGLQQTAPPAVFQSVVHLLDTEVPRRRRKEIEEQVFESHFVY